MRIGIFAVALIASGLAADESSDARIAALEKKVRDLGEELKSYDEPLPKDVTNSDVEEEEEEEEEPLDAVCDLFCVQGEGRCELTATVYSAIELDTAAEVFNLTDVQQKRLLRAEITVDGKLDQEELVNYLVNGDDSASSGRYIVVLLVLVGLVLSTAAASCSMATGARVLVAVLAGLCAVAPQWWALGLQNCYAGMNPAHQLWVIDDEEFKIGVSTLVEVLETCGRPSKVQKWHGL